MEIGLTPNSKPLESLIVLSKQGEVYVSRGQSTQIKGFFAVGDVTDAEEKQISVAVEQGAIVAISTYKYLVDNELITKKHAGKESWE